MLSPYTTGTSIGVFALMTPELVQGANLHTSGLAPSLALLQT